MTEDKYAQSSDVVIYEDAALPGLRIELIALEHKIHTLGATKAEYLNRIQAFNEEFERRLGNLVRKLAKLRDERLSKPHVQDGSSQYVHEEATGESFKKEHKEPVQEPLSMLSEQDREEIKKNYRQAGLLCHPDTVDESKKQSAEEIFKSLSSAYRNGDNKSVKIKDMDEYFDRKKEELLSQINLLLIRSAIGDSERISIL